MPDNLSDFGGCRARPPEDVARAVFRVVRWHVTAGEADDVIAVLPAGVQALWA